MSAPATIDLAELELTELETFVESLGHRRFHARQIYRWIWRRGVTEIARMTDLSRELRVALEAASTVSTPALTNREISEDGTQKFVLRMADGRQIESVFIPDTPKDTFCISTQVGCAMGCAFCLTGKMGLIRHLTAGEIAGQVRVLARELDLLDKPFNIVLMGMGEPLHNYDATMKALRMLNEAEGFALNPRRVTLSTVGLVPMLDRLAQEELMPNLAVSLHATTEEQRAAIVPTAKKYSVKDIIEACKRFPVRKRGRITFEYVTARRRQRLARRCQAAGDAAGGDQGQGEPDSPQRRGGHPVRTAVGRARGPLREDPGGPERDGVGPQEPRTRHPRRVRPADRRGPGREEIRGAAAGGGVMSTENQIGSIFRSPLPFEK